MNQDVQALKAHLAINVRNLEPSLKFYRKLFGLEPSKVRHGYAKFDVTNPPLNFTLNERPFSGPGALSHLGIQVGSSQDVRAIRQRWIEAGLIDPGRGEDRLLLRGAGQELGPRSRRKRMGSVRGAQG